MLLQLNFRFEKNKTVPVLGVKSDWSHPEMIGVILNIRTVLFKCILNMYLCTDIIEVYKHPNTNNMLAQDIEALHQLKGYKDIVIKSADQGGKLSFGPLTNTWKLTRHIGNFQTKNITSHKM